MDDEVPTDALGHVEIYYATRNKKPNELDHAGPLQNAKFRVC